MCSVVLCCAQAKLIDDTAMDIDMGAKPVKTKKALAKRIQKRRAKKSSIVFPKYKERTIAKKRK